MVRTTVSSSEMGTTKKTFLIFHIKQNKSFYKIGGALIIIIGLLYIIRRVFFQSKTNDLKQEAPKVQENTNNDSSTTKEEQTSKQESPKEMTQEEKNEQQISKLKEFINEIINRFYQLKAFTTERDQLMKITSISEFIGYQNINHLSQTLKEILENFGNKETLCFTNEGYNINIYISSNKILINFNELFHIRIEDKQKDGQTIQYYTVSFNGNYISNEDKVLIKKDQISTETIGFDDKNNTLFYQKDNDSANRLTPKGEKAKDTNGIMMSVMTGVQINPFFDKLNTIMGPQWDKIREILKKPIKVQN